MIQTVYPDGTISSSATYYDKDYDGYIQGKPLQRRVIKQDRHAPGTGANGDLTYYDELGRAFATDRMKDVVIDIVNDGPVKKSVYRKSGGTVSGSTQFHDSLTVYDAAGRVTQSANHIQAHQSKPVEYSYDKNGRRWKTHIGTGGVASYDVLTGFDSSGNVAWTIDPNHYHQVSGDIAGMTAEEVSDYVRNNENNVTRFLTRYTYDEFNRVTRTDLPHTSAEGDVFTQTKYDAAGRRWLEIDADGKGTAFFYDELGRLVWVVTDVHPDVTFPSPLKTTIGDWENWAKHTSRSASESTATEYVYDDFGRLTVQRDARANPTTYEYDNMDRRTKRTLPGGTYEAFVHDYLSPPLDPGVRVNKVNKVQRRDFAGRFTVTTMDRSGRLESRVPVDASGVAMPPDAANRGVSFTYTATGQRASMTEGSDQARSTFYAYDGFGRLRVKQQPEGNISYTYDDALNSIVEISARRPYPARNNAAWHVFDAASLLPLTHPTARPDGAHMQYAYANDDLQRLSDVSRGPLNDADYDLAHYSYDPNGNLASTDYWNDARSLTTSYQYNDRNHLRKIKSESDGTVVAAFDYDGVTPGTGLDWSGRTLTKSGLRRGVAEFIHYDNQNHQRTLAYDYDGLNRLRAERIRTANGTWPAFAPVTLPTTPATGDVLYDTTPGYSDASGYSDAPGYDKTGNRGSRSASGVNGVSTRNYGYDDNDRLNGALANGTTTATYDANGNTLLANAGENATWDRTQPDEYDFENRLIVRKLASPVYTGGQRWIELLYDGDGNRVRKTIKDWDVGRDPTVAAIYNSPDQTTAIRYLVDDRNLTGYAQVLEEQDAAGNPLVTYVYGLDLLTQTRNVGTVGSPNWQTHYFGYDGHGSVRYLVAAADGAVVTDTYTYDAFGVEIASPGSTVNHYRYCGEQWDADLGMYYLRARYLNPDSGRFWTRDTFEGGQSDPLSLHKYLYVHGNPVNGWDPSGHEFNYVGLASSMGIGAAVGAMSAYVSNNALGRAQTFSSIFQGAMFGMFLGPLAAESAFIAAGVASYSVAHSFSVAYAVVTDTNATSFQRMNAATLVVASLWGAKAARDFAKSTPLPMTSLSGENVGPIVRLYHKGRLTNGEVDSGRPLSLGPDREGIAALNREGEVIEFQVPARKLLEWERDGFVEKLDHTDHATGVRTPETRIHPPKSGELNQYKK